MIDLSGIAGFEWDDGNRDKNWIKHAVSTNECEEAFFNVPVLLQHDFVHSVSESRFFLLGQTNAGRFLFIAFVLRGESVRVISARTMSRKERAIYAKANS
jgi:uncharacterized DUF497 family protein